MRITIISVGKLKEKYLQMGIDEYSKRLSRYIKLELIEVADEKAPETMSPAEEDIVRKKEAERILANVKDGAYVVALAIDGKQLSSEGLAEFLQTNMTKGVSHMVFIIGGSMGLSKEVLTRADYKLSFSKMTFPHQLMRMILLEQVYRGFRIMNGEPYHK
jgi:23S rRNA (pseudouridine1915-N3)-methyltransferase